MNRHSIALTYVFVLVLLLPAHLLTQNAIPAPYQSSPIALVGGAIHTVTDGDILVGTIVFDRGKILSLGKTVDIPADAERIDISGKHVYPGLIDAYNTLGLTEIGNGSPGTVDISETGKINPSVRAEVAFHPESELIPVARSGGVTVALVAPSGGLISGTAAVMMLEGWTWEEMILKKGVGLIINWPRMTYIPNPFREQSESEWTKRRDKDLRAIKETFNNARAYMNDQQSARSAGKTEIRKRSDPNLDAMLPVLRGNMPVIVNATSVAQIQAAIRFAEDQGVRLILAGAYDAWRIAPLIKEKNIPIILVNVQNARRRWEGYDAIFTLAKRFMDTGIQYCITGAPSASNTRNLAQHAAHASAYGLPRDEALRTITIYPATILGISNRVGSLSPGKDATLLIANGDILEISTTVEQVYIEGRKVDMRDKHVRLYEKYRGKYRQLGHENH